jgi:predicted TIM-barrel fold metal-dependent hydrolase
MEKEKPRFKHSKDKLNKDFPVFDCDAHINDPLDIWNKYVEPQHRELVRKTYWRDDTQAILNGRQRVTGGGETRSNTYNPICIAGPGMNIRLMRRLQQMPLSAEQQDYLEHKGAYDPHARVRDLDLMGIDQVLIIPTMLVGNYPFAENIEGAYALARAYNNWARDWCDEVPDRLFPAGWLPLQNALYTSAELQRIAKMKFPVALVRPIDANGTYPNRIFSASGGGAFGNTLDPIFRAFEDTGIVIGMHTFPAVGTNANGTMHSPGQLMGGQHLSFIFEAMAWTAQVLLAGFLDRYPKLKMAIFESNATWFPELMERCDKLFALYKNERMQPAQRLPSEAFYQQCMIAFEADETPVFRQWDKFEDIGIWSSDAYHHDGAAAWSAIREMEDVEVPQEVQAKLLGANARRFYGIEGKCFISSEMDISRPDWFPKFDSQEFREWWEREAYPRKHGRGQARAEGESAFIRSGTSRLAY